MPRLSRWRMTAQSHAADVLLSQALLQRCEPLVFRAARPWRNLMLGFETILPFLRPIEHLIRDDSISEIMVNGSNHIFIERAGVLQEVPDITLSEKSLMVAVKNIARRLGDESLSRSPSWTPGCLTAAASQPSSRRAASTASRSRSESSKPPFHDGRLGKAEALMRLSPNA